MQGFSEKRKVEVKKEEEEKHKPLVSHPLAAPGMAEGPMALKESQKVEKMGRDSFEKSVKIELEGIMGKKKKKKGRKRRRKRKEKKE